jgi:hypothetical protein
MARPSTLELLFAHARSQMLYVSTVGCNPSARIAATACSIRRPTFSRVLSCARPPYAVGSACEHQPPIGRDDTRTELFRVWRGATERMALERGTTPTLTRCTCSR